MTQRSVSKDFTGNLKHVFANITPLKVELLYGNMYWLIDSNTQTLQRLAALITTTNTDRLKYKGSCFGFYHLKGPVCNIGLDLRILNTFIKVCTHYTIKV